MVAERVEETNLPFLVFVAGRARRFAFLRRTHFLTSSEAWHYQCYNDEGTEECSFHHRVPLVWVGAMRSRTLAVRSASVTHAMRWELRRHSVTAGELPLGFGVIDPGLPRRLITRNARSSIRLGPSQTRQQRVWPNAARTLASVAARND